VVLIALTGWGQDEDRRKSREAGFDGHMIKPVEPERLTGLLAEFPAVEVAADHPLPQRQPEQISYRSVR
jgi:CheY-like chemotaxis protein